MIFAHQSLNYLLRCNDTTVPCTKWKAMPFAVQQSSITVVHSSITWLSMWHLKGWSKLLVDSVLGKFFINELKMVFRCDKCDKIFSNKRALQNHTLIFHDPVDIKIFHCDQCPKRYAKQYQLNHHKKTHLEKNRTDFTCDECGKG